ncbi:transcriptional regulator, partial [Streptococcus suis]|nr:transcriptional regulator [Streptococcus suis]
SKEKIFQKVKERERRDKELIERVKGMNRSVKPEEFLSTITESLEEYNPKNDYGLLMDLALKTSSILFWLDIVFQKRTSEFYIVFEDKNFNENYYTHFYEKINVLFEEIKAAALEEARKDKNDFEDYKLTWGLD